MNDWPASATSRPLRQWPTLVELCRRVAAEDALDGVILLGSFAGGSADELSDLDLLAVAAPGCFETAWARRHALAADPLAKWERCDDSDGQIGWFKWLTRDLVKVECGIVDPDAGEQALAEPFAVVWGDGALAGRFARISRAEVEARAARIREEQKDFDPAAMTLGERIDWKLSELKQDVRAARAEALRAARSV